MPWGKHDDKFHSNRKVKPLRSTLRGLAALGLRSILHSECLDDPMLDGRILRSDLRTSQERKLAEALADAKLLDRIEDGYQIHDYADYNPTKDGLSQAKEKSRHRSQQYRERQRHEEETPPSRRDDDVTLSPVPYPVPERERVNTRAQEPPANPAPDPPAVPDRPPSTRAFILAELRNGFQKRYVERSGGHTHPEGSTWGTAMKTLADWLEANPRVQVDTLLDGYFASPTGAKFFYRIGPMATDPVEFIGNGERAATDQGALEREWGRLKGQVADLRTSIDLEDDEAKRATMVERLTAMRERIGEIRKAIE